MTEHCIRSVWQHKRYGQLGALDTGHDFLSSVPVVGVLLVGVVSLVASSSSPVFLAASTVGLALVGPASLKKKSSPWAGWTALFFPRMWPG